MKVVYAPIVSDASGRFGGMVATKWRATNAFRRFRAPANPKTTLQLEVRRIFINASRFWTTQGARTRAAWTAFALGKNFQGRNRYIALQVPAMKGAANANLMVGTPGDASTLGFTLCTFTAGAGSITCAATPWTAPTGWSVVGVVAYAFRDSDWGAVGISVVQVEGEDLVTPYSIILSGLATVLHQCRAFVIWLAPDGTTRYSASTPGTATPT